MNPIHPLVQNPAHAARGHRMGLEPASERRREAIVERDEEPAQHRAPEAAVAPEAQLFRLPSRFAVHRRRDETARIGARTAGLGMNAHHLLVSARVLGVSPPRVHLGRGRPLLTVPGVELDLGLAGQETGEIRRGYRVGRLRLAHVDVVLCYPLPAYGRREKPKPRFPGLPVGQSNFLRRFCSVAACFDSSRMRLRRLCCPLLLCRMSRWLFDTLLGTYVTILSYIWTLAR